MTARFTSNNADTSDFLAMGRLLGFLETCNDKNEKVVEIKYARDRGLIDEEIALELTIEFCR